MDTIEDTIGRAVRALGNGGEAAILPEVANATRRHPGEARLWQVLGLLHRNLEDLEPATAALARAASLDPASAKIAHAHARATLESGAESLPLFDRALGLAPNDGELLISRSAAMLAEGRLSAAIQEFDLHLSRSPLWIQGHRSVSQLRWLAGETDDFTQSFDRALALHPGSADLWIEKVNVLIRAEQYGAAATVVQQARSAIGDLPVLRFNQAICASEANDRETADRLFESFTPIADVTVGSRYIRHLLRTQRADEAARIAEPLTTLPDADHIWPYISVAWRLLGDPRWEWLEGDPRLIGSYDISDELGSIDELAAKLRGLHTAVLEPMDQSVRGGTQTDGPLFARVDPVIRRAREAIRGAIRRHLDNLPPPDPTHPHLRHDRSAIRFAGSWSVRLTGGGHHSSHVHPQGFVSSALYVVVPPEAESGPAPAGHLVFGEPPAELGIELPPIRVIRPEPGRLALFPSTMWHGTRSFAGGERMTIAFDVAKPR